MNEAPEKTISKILNHLLKQGYVNFTFLGIDYTLEFNVSRQRLELRPEEPSDHN